MGLEALAVRVATLGRLVRTGVRVAEEIMFLPMLALGEQQALLRLATPTSLGWLQAQDLVR
jgi:hypothetical protein